MLLPAPKLTKGMALHRSITGHPGILSSVPHIHPTISDKVFDTLTFSFPLYFIFIFFCPCKVNLMAPPSPPLHPKQYCIVIL